MENTVLLFFSSNNGHDRNNFGRVYGIPKAYWNIEPLENYLSPLRNTTILMVRRNLLEQGDPVLLAWQILIIMSLLPFAAHVGLLVFTTREFQWPYNIQRIIIVRFRYIYLVITNIAITNRYTTKTYQCYFTIYIFMTNVGTRTQMTGGHSL